jgi:hypothetical protein
LCLLANCTSGLRHTVCDGVAVTPNNVPLSFLPHPTPDRISGEGEGSTCPSADTDTGIEGFRCEEGSNSRRRSSRISSSEKGARVLHTVFIYFTFLFNTLPPREVFFILYSLIFRYHLPVLSCPVLSCPVLSWAESGLFLLRLPCSPFNNYIVIPLYRSVPRSPCLYLCPYPARFTPSRFNAFYLPSPLP